VFSEHGERFGAAGGGSVPAERGGVTVDLEVAQSSFSLTFAPPVGERFRTGVLYTAPVTLSQDPAQFTASGFARGCSARSTFLFHQLELDGSGVPLRLDATFEQTCVDARSEHPLRGRLSYRATTPTGPHAEAWARAATDLHARLGRAPTLDERYPEAERLLSPSPIRTRWRFLGGESGLALLGPATGPERSAGDGRGRVQPYRSGVIAWSPRTGAHEVRGAIHGTWARLGGVRSALGYPTSDEFDTADARGRWNGFEHGFVHWSPRTGAHEVRGAIHARWLPLGAERGRLGYPVSDEYDVPGGRASDFERGRITWTRATGAVAVTSR
jgi:hypothetical protein